MSFCNTCMEDTLEGLPVSRKACQNGWSIAQGTPQNSNMFNQFSQDFICSITEKKCTEIEYLCLGKKHLPLLQSLYKTKKDQDKKLTKPT